MEGAGGYLLTVEVDVIGRGRWGQATVLLLSRIHVGCCNRSLHITQLND